MLNESRFANIRENNNLATKVFFILINVSFILWLFTIAGTQIHKFAPSAFFYIGQLSSFYWLGLGVLISVILLLLFMKISRLYDGNAIVDFACIIVFALYLFGTPSFVYDAPRFGDVYHVLDMTHTMIGDAGFTLTGTGGDFGYLNSFPGAIIFFSFIKLVGNVSDFALANYYVIYLMILLSLILYIISRRVSNYFMLIAPVCFLSLAWVQEYHLSPQSLALILYLCIWFFIISRVLLRWTPVAGLYEILMKKYRSIITYLLLALLSLSIVISHPGTPIFLILNAVVPYAVLKVFKRFNILDLNFNIFDIIILVLPFTFWLVFVTPAYLNQAINLMSLTALSLFSNHITLVDYTPTIAQPDQVFVDTLRQIVTIAESLIGFLCIILLLRKETRREAIIFGGWFISCFAFQLFGFSQNFVSGRFLIFAIFPFAILVALVISRISKSWLNAALSVTAIILLISSALLIPLIGYGGDYYEFKPLTNTYMDRFVALKNVPHIDIAVYGVEFLKTNVEGLHNVYLVDGLDENNLFRVKFSKDVEYAGMFNKTGMSSIYTNGDYSLHGFINNSLSP